MEPAQKLDSFQYGISNFKSEWDRSIKSYEGQVDATDIKFANDINARILESTQDMIS